MAPPRSRPPPDDSKSEASSTKEKAGPSASNAVNGKGRRVAGNPTGGSSLRDVVTAGTSGGAVTTTVTTITEITPGVSVKLRRTSILLNLCPAPMVYLRPVNSARISL